MFSLLLAVLFRLFASGSNSWTKNEYVVNGWDRVEDEVHNVVYLEYWNDTVPEGAAKYPDVGGKGSNDRLVRRMLLDIHAPEGYACTIYYDEASYQIKNESKYLLFDMDGNSHRIEAVFRKTGDKSESDTEENSRDRGYIEVSEGNQNYRFHVRYSAHKSGKKQRVKFTEDRLQKKRNKKTDEYLDLTTVPGFGFLFHTEVHKYGLKVYRYWITKQVFVQLPQTAKSKGILLVAVNNAEQLAVLSGLLFPEELLESRREGMTYEGLITLCNKRGKIDAEFVSGGNHLLLKKFEKGIEEYEKNMDGPDDDVSAQIFFLKEEMKDCRLMGEQLKQSLNSYDNKEKQIEQLKKQVNDPKPGGIRHYMERQKRKGDILTMEYEQELERDRLHKSCEELNDLQAKIMMMAQQIGISI